MYMKLDTTVIKYDTTLSFMFPVVYVCIFRLSYFCGIWALCMPWVTSSWFYVKTVRCVANLASCTWKPLWYKSVFICTYILRNVFSFKIGHWTLCLKSDVCRYFRMGLLSFSTVGDKRKNWINSHWTSEVVWLLVSAVWSGRFELYNWKIFTFCS